MASDFRLGISQNELEQLVELLWRASWGVKTTEHYTKDWIEVAIKFHDRFATILKKQEADKIVDQYFSSLAEEREYNRAQRELAEELLIEQESD